MAAIKENSEPESRPVSAVDNHLNNNSSTPPPIIERRIATDGLRRKNVFSESTQSPALCERCVVVARQSDGFGLTVNGEYPLTVSTLKSNGAAQLAGVKEGDRILKVNGMLVSCENFQEVIKMISGGYNLVLTLLGPARTHSVSSWDDELFPAIQQMPKENKNNNNGFLIPYFNQNSEQMMLSSEWQQQRKDELYRMLNKERANLESLKISAGIIDTEKQNQIEFGGGAKLERAICRINELEKQLNILSLLNAVSNGKKRVLNKNDKKRGSIESTDTEQQSSKTFPPTSMRTKTNNNSSVPLRAANAAVGRVEPIRSWIETGGMNYVQADVLPIEDEEEEEDYRGERSEGDTEDMETAGPYTNLQYLKTRPAHLAVFTSYLLNNANPSSLLFFFITDAFPTSNLKEMRRFAYEIFSTFLIPGAPLQLPNISQRDIQAIDKILIKMSSATTSSSAQQQDVDQLKKLFIPTRTKAVGQINEQLALFRRKRHLDTNFVEEYSQLESLSRTNHSAELRFAERILFKTLAHLVHLANPLGPTEWENCERKTLALIISVATLIKVVMCLRTNHSNWEKLLDKCPTFLSQIPKSGGTASSMFKMLGGGSGGGTSVKQKIQLKEHQFVLQSVFITVHCYQCREAVWGVNPQAYFCQNCDVVVHKNCTSQLLDHCWPQQQQKVSKGGTQQQISTGRSSKLVAGSTISLTSPSHLPQHYHRDSNVSSVHHHHYYPHSLLSAESSVFSSPSLALTKQRQLEQKQQQHLNLLPSQKSSISLTPPINRSPHSISVSALAMAGSSKEGSRSIDRHGNDLIPPELIDADAATNGAGGENGPLIPNAVTRLQHQQHMESLDSGSSPPSSTAMLPPPVFSSRFERILPPDIPPSNAPPPPPLQKTTGNGKTETTLNVASTLQPSTANTAGGKHGQLKSMDSGIGTDVTCVSGPSSVPMHGGIGRTASDLPRAIAQQQQQQLQQQQHPSIGPTRSQSMKGEAANQLKRGAKGAGSLGAADSADEQQRPITSQLAVPSVSSLKSSSSSAQELSQAFHEFPHFIRGTEAVASSSTTGTSSEEEARKMVEIVERTAVADGDSDLEVETEVPSLESLVGWEVLKHLKPKEKKRQEVINELFHTERTHVRNLKILYKVFYRPMVLQRVASPELIKLLFGNLDELLQVHSEMNRKMREAVENWQRLGIGNEGGGLYGDIGELIVNLFDGAIGEKLMHNTALFCRNQQHALDTLRQRYTRAKDDPFSQFLSEAENNILCRKLQLKDMIPVEMQRLVKYPLLLETIAKYTREGSDELQHLLHGIERAKRILSVVNSDKRNAENEKRMEELQQRVDFTGCEKSFFQRFDFRAHKLIYDGHLQWRQARGKTLDLHVVLLEHLLVFLTKIGSDSGNASTPQKLQLKIHEAGCIPIMRLSAVEVEEKPGDKRSFNLLYKSDLRVFELVSQTATEKKTWFRLIENQVSVTRSSPIPADFENIFDGILTSGVQQQQQRSTPPPSSLVQRAQIVDSGLHQVAKVEHVHVLTHPALVNANEIVIQQPKIMENAQPIISVADRLLKNDKLIINALAEKHQLLTELLLEEGNKTCSNTNELERITELMTGLSVTELKQRNSKELAMSAIVHGNRLLDCINQGMNNVNKTVQDLTEETERNLPSVPCYRLTAIAAPLMNHLKALLQVIQNQSVEIQRLKETEQNSSRKTASEETLVQSGLSPGSTSSKSVVVATTPHLTALRATPSNCSSLSSPTSSPHTVLPFE